MKRNWKAAFLYLQGRALVGLERPDEARAVLQQGPSLLRASDSRWYFLELVTLLADLEEKTGNETPAADLRQEARTLLEYIIEHIPEGELRASFVALPEVGRPGADDESYPPAGQS